MKTFIFVLTASLSFCQGFLIQKSYPSANLPFVHTNVKNNPKLSSFTHDSTTTPHQKYHSFHTTLSSSTSTDNAAGYSLQVMERDENSIGKAATFMMDAFWLQPSQIVDVDADISAISGGARANLEETQREDLMEKYGERMGKRILNSCIISANDEEDMSLILGMVCIEVALLDKDEKTILKTSDSEKIVTNAVASLKPSQRRQYKNASVSDIADKLLPESIQATVLLSNLAVSPNARKRGIGTQLCLEAERIVKEEWGMDFMCLKVEGANSGARGIYEGGTLKYELFHTDPSCEALRVNIEEGALTEVEVETLTLMKSL